jgi:hypothetical protein
MSYFSTPTYAFGGRIAKSGTPIEKKSFPNGDFYEYGRLKTGGFYCRWHTVGVDSGLKKYKTEAGAKSKFHGEVMFHKYTKKDRDMMAYISSNAREHREGCRRYR